MNENALLEHVLEGYAVDTPHGNDLVVLKKWISEFPQFADDLMDFASIRAQQEHLPDPEISEADAARYKKKGLELLEQILGESKKKPSRIRSLSGLANEQGLDKIGFASALGISISLLMYLEKRRLEVKSIPRAFLKKIAESVKSTEENVVSYLSAGPELSPQASFKAESRPKPPKKKSFLEAVKEDPGLTNEQKESLLNLV